MRSYVYIMVPLSALLMLSACGNTKTPAMPVAMQKVINAELPENLILTGTLEADRQTDIAANISGRIQHIAVAEGDRVKANQVLIRLDPLTEAVANTGVYNTLRQAEKNASTISELYDERIAGTEKNISNLRETAEKGVDIAAARLQAGSDDYSRNLRDNLTSAAITSDKTKNIFQKLFGLSSKYDEGKNNFLLDRHIGVSDPRAKDSALFAYYDFKTKEETLREFYNDKVLSGSPSDGELAKGITYADEALVSAKILLESINVLLDSSVTSAEFSETDLNDWYTQVSSAGRETESLLSRVEALQNKGTLNENIGLLEESKIQATLQARAEIEQAELSLMVLRKEKEAKLAEAESLIRSLQAEIGITGAQLSQTVLYAPYDGIVTKKMSEKGQVIAPGMPLLTVANDEDLKLVINVPDSAISSLATGREASVQIDGMEDAEFQATLARIASFADPLSKKIDIELKVNNKNKQLKVGMFARATFPLSTQSGLLVPASAVLSRYGINLVFVAQNGKAIQRVVEIGNRTEKTVAISKGVTEGEMVLTKGHLYLRDGDEIEEIKIDMETANFVSLSST